MAGTKNINKSQKVKQADVKINVYELLDGKDGNPQSPAEHDGAAGYEDEMYFKADEDADENDKKRVLILNYIHRELHHITQRKVPVLDPGNDLCDVEVYHRVTFQGVELDVCVYWAPRVDGEYKSCVAMVKLTSDDPSAENAGHIETDAAWNADAKADKFTLKNDKLRKNYWAPRFKYVVNALRNTAYHRYEKNGDQKPPEPEPVTEIEDDAADNESNEEREEVMSVFMGSTGKIIGPKGAKIIEIKQASKVTDIKMPPKGEDGEPRPKARSLVDITIIGKSRAIAKARELVQEVVDQWANAPRGGSFQASAPDNSNGGDGLGTTSGGGDDWENGGPTSVEINGSWDDANGTGQASGGGSW